MTTLDEILDYWESGCDCPTKYDVRAKLTQWADARAVRYGEEVKAQMLEPLRKMCKADADHQRAMWDLDRRGHRYEHNCPYATALAMPLPPITPEGNS